MAPQSVGSGEKEDPFADVSVDEEELEENEVIFNNDGDDEDEDDEI